MVNLLETMAGTQLDFQQILRHSLGMCIFHFAVSWLLPDGC